MKKWSFENTGPSLFGVKNVSIKGVLLKWPRFVLSSTDPSVSSFFVVFTFKLSFFIISHPPTFPLSPSQEKSSDKKVLIGLVFFLYRLKVIHHL